MTVWQFRRAGRSDLAGIMAIEEPVFPTDAWSPELMLGELEALHTYYLVAHPFEHPTTLVAYAGLSVVGEQGDIQTIAVAEEARGQGLGRALMQQLIAEARQRGAEELFLEVRADNPVAQGLYRSLGFEQISVRRRYYQPDDVDALIFRLTLPETRTELAAEAPEAPEGDDDHDEPDASVEPERNEEIRDDRA